MGVLTSSLPFLMRKGGPLCIGRCGQPQGLFVSEKRVSKSGCEHLYVLVWVVVRTLLIEALFVFICQRAPDPPTYFIQGLLPQGDGWTEEAAV